MTRGAILFSDMTNTPMPDTRDASVGHDASGYASPTQSSMAAARASAGVLPPQRTNWKAG